MEFARCTEFATEHPICYIATEDGDQPRVRALLLWFADERGFYFMTMSPKGFSHQLHDNPKVEVCFYNGASELSDAVEMRVTGAVEFVHDAELTTRSPRNARPRRDHRPPARAYHRGVLHRLGRGTILDADGHPQEDQLETVRF